MNLNLTCPINFRSYGITSLNILSALTNEGVDIALFPIGPIEAPPESHPLIKKCIENQAKFDQYAPSLRIWHQFDLAQHVGRGRRVAFPIFELDEFNVREKHHIKANELVFVTSRWGRDVVLDAGIHKDCIAQIPLGVDRTIYNPKVEPMSPKGGKFRVLYIGKLEIRKGADIAHQIFKMALPSEKDVELLVSWANPFMPDTEMKSFEEMYVKEIGADRVKFIPWLPTEKDMARLMQYSDVGLFPYRAEGWALSLLNMMSMGKWCIATNYSAPTEYINRHNCRTVDIGSWETAYDGKWFTSGIGQWAQLGIDQVSLFCNYLRKEYLRWKECKGQVPHNDYGIEVAQSLSWEKTAKRIVDNLLA